MNEWLIVAAAVLAGASGLVGLRRERVAVAVLLLAAACGVAGGVLALARPSTTELAAAWSVPGGRLALLVDPLSAIFVIQIALLAALCAIYGLGYYPQREQPRNGGKVRAFYGVVTAGLLLVVTARNAVLFLAGWELMALGAFLLVSAEDQQAIARESGYLYLVSTRLSTLCLFAMFALLFTFSGTLDFAGWPSAMRGPAADAIFVLALVGFGLKAGVMPLHVWLPGAHANTPSHVSALMSGVLIKMGIYGLLRITSMCAAPPPWWGHAVLAVGVVSAILGVAFAIGQHDLKRLLAYHSVENIGIICTGLGVALLGRAEGRDDWIALGLAGALLHTWNHGLFKALLFLSAGSVLHATGTRELDRLGGLWRRMPSTAMAFLVGAVAICGLPPLNGLISELLVFLGLFRVTMGAESWMAGALAAPALALVGALAVACFVKVVGVVFLGQPRGEAVAGAHESGRAMLAPMAILAALCLLIGLGAPAIAPVLDRAAAAWAGHPLAGLAGLAPLARVSLVGVALLAALAALGAWVAARTRTTPAAVGTWDCGYAAPTARMQYTASSFAQLIVRMFGWALRPETHPPTVDALFPTAGSFRSHVPDTVLDRGARPVAEALARAFSWMRPLQAGSIHLYLLYILGALLVLLVWR